MTKEELQKKWPNFKAIKHDPKDNCKFCKGVGERGLRDGRLVVCICACVGHEFSDIAGDALSKVARDGLEKLTGGGK